MTTTTVTPATLQTALTHAQGGDTLVLQGAFGRITAYGVKPAAKVTLDCSGATITDLAVSGSSNLEFVGGVFGPYAYMLAQVSGSDHITFRGCKFIGGDCGVSFTKCTYSGVFDSVFRKSTGDGVDLQDCSFCAVQRCDFADNAPAAGIHPDAVQCWGTAQGTSHDNTFTDNHIAGHMQGISCFGTPVGVVLERMNISRNVISTTYVWAGLWVFCKDSVLQDNIACTLIGATPGFAAPNWTMTDGPEGSVDSGKSGNFISGNISGVKP